MPCQAGRGGQGERAGPADRVGWSDIVDLGDIFTARGTEMYLPLWLRLWGALGTPMFSIKAVR